jgi:ParB family chromosome partitioning protein
VGRDRSTVANALRLLKLPADVVVMVDDGRLSEGHARALLGLNDHAKILRFAGHAVESGWSVRDLEKKVRNARPAVRGRTEPVRQQSPAHRRVEETGSGSNRRRHGALEGAGRSTQYYSEDDLARLLASSSERRSTADEGTRHHRRGAPDGALKSRTAIPLWAWPS